MLAPLVVGGEARRVRRLGDLALEDLLEGVGALARGRVDVAHQMHLEGVVLCRNLIEGFDVGCGPREFTCMRKVVLGLSLVALLGPGAS